jgi:hypothetical protein
VWNRINEKEGEKGGRERESERREKEPDEAKVWNGIYTEEGP